MLRVEVYGDPQSLSWALCDFSGCKWLLVWNAAPRGVGLKAHGVVQLRVTGLLYPRGLWPKAPESPKMNLGQGWGQWCRLSGKQNQDDYRKLRNSEKITRRKGNPQQGSHPTPLSRDFCFFRALAENGQKQLNVHVDCVPCAHLPWKDLLQKRGKRQGLGSRDRNWRP